jgi:hypothetical protein
MSDEQTPPTDTLRCGSCGAENRSGARFCRACGSPLSASEPTAQQNPSAPPAPTALPEPQPAEGVSAASTAPTETNAAPTGGASGGSGGWLAGRRSTAIGGIAALAVVVVLLIVFAGPLSEMLSPTVTAYVLRDTAVVSSTDQNAKTLETEPIGNKVRGHWVAAPDGQGRWLKIASGGKTGFIWGRNLSETQKPNPSPVTESTLTVRISAPVFAEPEPSSQVIDIVADGETPALLGTVNGPWDAIALPEGGVGYVRQADLDGAGPPADASPALKAELAQVVHYTCTFQAQSTGEATAQLSFWLDGGRDCINHRYPYFEDDASNLKRVMLNDGARVVSVLYFPSDRKTFTRTDFTLPPDAYLRTRKAAAALDTATCAAPGDAQGLAAQNAELKRITPPLDPQSSDNGAKQRVWKCVVAPVAASAAEQ